MLDVTLYQIWFHSSKEGPSHIVQDWPGSNSGGPVRFWPNMSGPVASQCARNIVPGSGRMQPACYQFPMFRLSCILLQMVGSYCTECAVDLVWFWLTVSGFGPNRSSLEASQCARIIRPALANASNVDVNQIQHAYWGKTTPGSLCEACGVIGPAAGLCAGCTCGTPWNLQISVAYNRKTTPRSL